MTHPQTTDWTAILAVLGAGIFAAFQVGKVPAALPAITAELGLGLVAAGWLISLLGTAGALGGLLAGSLSDAIGHRRTLLGGLAIIGAGSLLGSLADAPAVILASRTLEAVGFIAVAVVGPALMVRAAAPAHARIIFGIWGTYMSVGMSAVMLLAPPVLEAWGWRGLWAANAVGAVLMGAVAARATRALATSGTHTGAPRLPALLGARMVLARPAPLVLALCFACYAVNYFAVLGFLPMFFVNELGYAQRTALPLVALVVLMNAVGALLGSWLLQTGTRRWRLLAFGSAAMGACAFGVFAQGASDPLRYGFALLFPLTGALVPVSVLAAAPVHAPSPGLIAGINGLFMQGSNVGQLIGPPLLAAIVAAGGSWQAAPLLTSVTATAGVLLALVVRRLER